VTIEVNKCITRYLHGDLRKLKAIHSLYLSNEDILSEEIVHAIFKSKCYNEDTKEITKQLLNQKMTLDDHLYTINETDRTIVGLLWHENIVDSLSKLPKPQAYAFYQEALRHICFADYIDRVTFQKQIWQFNEMSSLIKTFYINKLYHETFDKKPKYNPPEVRFTKVLTKYSTEYNNTVFIQTICQQLGMDKKDAFIYFIEMKNTYPEETIYAMLEPYEICKLDIHRMYRYLDKYTLGTDSTI